MVAPKAFVTTFEAAHFIALGEVRSYESYVDEALLEFGADRPFSLSGNYFHYVLPKIGDDNYRLILDARQRLKDAAGQDAIKVRGWPDSMVRVRTGTSGINYERSTEIPEAAKIIESGLFVGDKFTLDLISSKLNFVGFEKNGEFGIESYPGTKYENLVFSFDEIARVFGGDAGWRIKSGEQQNVWVVRVEVHAEAVRRWCMKERARKSNRELSRILAEMAGECDVDWKSNTLETVLRERGMNFAKICEDYSPAQV